MFANIPAVRPASTALGAASKELHHSAGILSRCHHFETAEALAPMAPAMDSLEGQRSMMERKEVGSGMDSLLGQIVLKSKAIMSYDCEQPFGDNAAMADRMSETEEKAAFIGRVRSAREAKFTTQKPVYTFLGIEQGQYKHYEINRELPRRYQPKFCMITEVSLEWLLTGEGKGPVVPEIPKETPRRIRKQPRGRAA